MLAVVLVSALGAAAAAIDERPTLTETQKLQIANIAQAIEIAQLKAQMAQRDFDQAREQLRTLVQQLDRPGFVLDLPTLSYRPVPTEAPK